MFEIIMLLAFLYAATCQLARTDPPGSKPTANKLKQRKKRASAPGGEKRYQDKSRRHHYACAA